MSCGQRNTREDAIRTSPSTLWRVRYVVSSCLRTAAEKRKFDKPSEHMCDHFIAALGTQSPMLPAPCLQLKYVTPSSRKSAWKSCAHVSTSTTTSMVWTQCTVETNHKPVVPLTNSTDTVMNFHLFRPYHTIYYTHAM